MHGIVAERHGRGERADGRRALPVQEDFCEIVLVDGHGDCLADAQVFEVFILEVERDLIDARRVDLTDLVLVVIHEKFEARIRQALHSIELAVLHRHRQRVAVRDALDNDLVHLRLHVAPVVFVFHKVDLRVGNGRRDIRARADDDLVMLARIDVDDAAVRIGQVVQERRHFFLRFDRDGLAVRRDGLDLQVFRRTVMLRKQVVKAFLNLFARDFLAVREADIILQIDFDRVVVNLLVVLREPRLELHGLREAEQRLADAVAQRRPADVRVMRIRADVLVRDAVGNRAVRECFVVAGRFLSAAAAAARREERCREEHGDAGPQLAGGCERLRQFHKVLLFSKESITCCGRRGRRAACPRGG